MKSGKELLALAVLGVTVVAVGLGVLANLPEKDTILGIALFVPTIVIAPLIIIGVAMVRRSKGYVLGTVAALPFLLAATQAVLWLQVLKIATFNDRDLRPPEHSHDTILMQDTRYGVPLSEDACDDICRQILLTTSLNVIVEAGDGRSWARFTLGHGADCSRSIRQYAYMLAHRYLDVCPVRMEATRPEDALVVTETFNNGSMIAQRQPLNSNAIELFERSGNADVPLGRWASVVGMEGMLFDPLAISENGDLASFSRWDFYSRVLNRDIVERLPTGAAPIEDVLAALRPLFDDPEQARTAMSAFETLARAKVGKGDLRAFLQTRISELESARDPDPQQVEWCQTWLDRLST